MSWQDETIPIVRHLIGDFTSPYIYVDDRLTDIIITAAHLLNREISFDNDYTISISSCSITPDPSTDVGFINLVSLKTACIIANSEAKTLESQAVVIKDGPSSLDTTAKVKAAREHANNTCAMFDKAKLDFISGNAVCGQIIKTPYTIEFYN